MSAVADSSREAAHAGLAIAALVVGGFAIGTTEFVSMGVLPEVAAGVGVDIPTAGHAISAYALGVVVGAPTIAVLAARMPRRGLLLALMALFVVGNVATAAAVNYPMLLVARFVSGMPHGAFFGVGALVAASLVAPHRRGRAIGRMMYGIPAANLAGVPAATWLGQAAGWRWTYAAVAACGALTAILLLLVVPAAPGDPRATGRRELSALRIPTLWLSMSAGALGFGGMFAMYSYIAPTLTEVTQQPSAAIPPFLFIYGLGGLVGAELGGRMAERSVFWSVATGFAATSALLAAFALVSPWAVPAAVVMFLVSMFASLLVINLQMQLMHDAGPAETLGAALNHSALNAANALGAWVGGLVLAAGYGYRMPSVVGAGLALLGLVCLAAYVPVERRRRARAEAVSSSA